MTRIKTKINKLIMTRMKIKINKFIIRIKIRINELIMTRIKIKINNLLRQERKHKLTYNDTNENKNYFNSNVTFSTTVTYNLILVSLCLLFRTCLRITRILCFQNTLSDLTLHVYVAVQYR